MNEFMQIVSQYLLQPSGKGLVDCVLRAVEYCPSIANEYIRYHALQEAIERGRDAGINWHENTLFWALSKHNSDYFDLLGIEDRPYLDGGWRLAISRSKEIALLSISGVNFRKNQNKPRASAIFPITYENMVKACDTDYMFAMSVLDDVFSIVRMALYPPYSSL